MNRITDAWNGLGRRERVLVGALGGAALVVVLLLVLLRGGGDAPTVIADSAATASVDKYGPVQPQPGMIVADTASTVPGAGSPTGDESDASGVAPIADSGGSGDSSGGDGGWAIGVVPGQESHDPTPPGAMQPPVVSDAVKATGRDLERAAADYRACWEAAQKANADARHCINELKYGVYVDSEVPRHGGIVVTKRSSDGHRLDYVLMPPPQAACRVLDEGKSCNGWTT